MEQLKGYVRKSHMKMQENVRKSHMKVRKDGK